MVERVSDASTRSGAGNGAQVLRRETVDRRNKLDAMVYQLEKTLSALEKKTVAEIARERGRDGLDTFLDIPLEDDLKTQYIVPLFNSNEEGVRELITDPRTMIGLSDGGAAPDRSADCLSC